MTNAEIDAIIEGIRGDAEADIEDFKSLYTALVVLRAQRDAFADVLRGIYARAHALAENTYLSTDANASEFAQIAEAALESSANGETS